MLIKDSDKRIIGKTGTSYYEVTIKCSSCKKLFHCERNRAKKRKHMMCGSCYSKSALKGSKLKGKIPPNKQIKCLVPCEWCRKLRARTKRRLEKYKHTWCNSSCQNKWQQKYTDFNKGSKNPSYIHGERVGGKTPNYGPEFTKELKRSIKIRDGFNCVSCTKNFSGKLSKGLDVHHIDTDKFNNKEDNLVCLCKSCHLKTHWELRTLNK